MQEKIQLQNLVEHLVQGEQDQLEAIFKKFPNSLIEEITIQDKSGRRFFNISPWQYILWSLDTRYMAPILLKCLPSNDEGEIRLNLENQTKILKEKGISYTLKGSIFNESYYNFGIIDVLTNYLNNYNSRTPNERDSYWNNVVREEELLVPAHVAQHYCGNQSFYPTPGFDTNNFHRSLSFFNWMTKKPDSWYSSNLALFRGAEDGATPSLKGPRPPSIKADLEAMKKLHDQRMKDLTLLLEQLNQHEQLSHLI
jgi:hypothetical protein